MSDATDEGQSTAKHTPGPWEVYPETVPIGEPKGYSVRASCEPSDKVCLSVTHPDARLIAAAPDMLEALQHIAALRWGWEGDCGAVAIAEAAINAATAAGGDEQ